MAKRKRFGYFNEMGNASPGVLDEAVRNAQKYVRKCAFLRCVKVYQFVRTSKGTTNRPPPIGCRMCCEQAIFSQSILRYGLVPNFHTFHTENQANSTKNYVKGTSQTPGIFTVLCASQHHILIGISVMLENEGISTALSTLLLRFKKFSKVTYYDNDCTIARRISRRVPWMSDKSLIVCDRFHYR